MKFHVYSWTIQSLYTAHMRRRKHKPLNWEVIKKHTHGKFPTKHHVEVTRILHCTQRLIRSKLNQMMTWLHSVGILPAHKETTTQPFPLIPSIWGLQESKQCEQCPWKYTLFSPLSASILHFQPFWKCLKLSLQILLAWHSAMHYRPDGFRKLHWLD